MGLVCFGVRSEKKNRALLDGFFFLYSVTLKSLLSELIALFSSVVVWWVALLFSF